MICSIVYTDCYSVGSNKANKIKVGETSLSIDNDIPFVRYRFSEYNDKQFEFIKECKSRFARSTHLVEVNIDDNIEVTLQKVIELGNVAKYIYVDITEEDVQASGIIRYDIRKNIIKTAQYIQYVDRIMIRDKSETLDACTTQKIFDQIRGLIQSTGVKAPSLNTFGVCSSPLSFGEYACLTAVRARELMSKYSEISDVALPSANHQCMNCCGCIRYVIVDKDYEAPPETGVAKEKKEKKVKEKTENNTVKEKAKAKVGLLPGRFTL